MKKKPFPVIAALAAVLTLFAACYQDIELDDPTPGSLLPVAGVYNMRDVGGYATYDETMYAGQILQAFQSLQKFKDAVAANPANIVTAYATLRAENPMYLTQLASDTNYNDNVTAFQGALMGNLAKTLPAHYAVGNLTPADGSTYINAIADNMTPGHVKRGYIIRSGELNRLTDRDVKYLSGLGIKEVIDFRGATAGSRGVERDKARDKDIPGVTHGQTLDPNAASKFAIEESIVGSMGSYIEPSIGTYETTQVMITGYRKLVGGTGTQPVGGTDYTDSADNADIAGKTALVQLRNFFKELIYSDFMSGGTTLRTEPLRVIYHCSAGKDRTGVATALLLSALGVPREAVIKDYLLSAEYVKEKYTPVVNGLGAQLEPLVTVKREYIEAMFQYIDVNFRGTVLIPYPAASYDETSAVIKFLKAVDTGTVQQGLGLTDAQIRHLRKLYLER